MVFLPLYTAIEYKEREKLKCDELSRVRFGIVKQHDDIYYYDYGISTSLMETNTEI